MNDRVRFLTTQDNRSPNVFSGCNGFPVPFQDVADKSTETLQRTLPEFVRLYFRAKTWSMTTDAQVATSDGSSLIFTTPGTGGIRDGATNPITRERDLFYDSNNDLFVGGPADFTGTATVTFNGAGLTLFGGNRIDPFPSPVIYKDFVPTPPEFYIDVVISGAIGLRIGSPGDPNFEQAIVEFDTNQAVLEGNTGEPITGTINATVDGQTVPLYYWLSTFHVGAGIPTASISSMDFSITEYWPYAALDASPIYDTATGAQLQDPTN